MHYQVGNALSVSRLAVKVTQRNLDGGVLSALNGDDCVRLWFAADVIAGEEQSRIGRFKVWHVKLVSSLIGKRGLPAGKCERFLKTTKDPPTNVRYNLVCVALCHKLFEFRRCSIRWAWGKYRVCD